MRGETEKPKVKRGEVMEIYVDGASRRNPGPAAISFIFVKDGEVIHEYGEYIGETTNNVAEYKAIIVALKQAKKFTRWKIIVYSDSQLVINQINGVYRIRKEHLEKLCGEVYDETKFYEKVEFRHRSRNNEYIRMCDKICNEILSKNGV